MTKITLDLPETLFVRTRADGVVTETPVSDIPADILATCVAHGWQQKNVDSASAAARIAATAALPDDASDADIKAWMTDDANADAISAERVTIIKDSVAARLAGDWNTRGVGTTADPMDVYRAQAVRKVLANPSNAKRKAEYDAIPSDDQKARVAFLLDLFAKHEKALTPAAEELRQIAEAKQALSVDVTM